MDAPLYSPAVGFEQPRILPRLLSVKETVIADLQKVPAAWAIVNKEIPGIDRRIAGPLSVHLGNFSLQSLVQFGAVPMEVLPRIDAQLKALGFVR